MFLPGEFHGQRSLWIIQLLAHKEIHISHSNSWWTLHENSPGSKHWCFHGKFVFFTSSCKVTAQILLEKVLTRKKKKNQQYQFWRDYTTQVWPCSHQLADSWAMDCHQQRKEYHLEISTGMGKFNWEEMSQDWPVVTLTFKIIIIKEREK